MSPQPAKAIPVQVIDPPDRHHPLCRKAAALMTVTAPARKRWPLAALDLRRMAVGILLPASMTSRQSLFKPAPLF